MNLARRQPITKTYLTSRAIIYQLIGYGVLLFLIVGDELFDFPHTVFGSAATPVNWSEVVIESGYIIGLCALTVYFSYRLIREIKFLEGHLPVCTFCKKIRDENGWNSIEDYISKHSEALFSHGLCPECAEEHYGEFFKEERK